MSPVSTGDFLKALALRVVLDRTVGREAPPPRAGVVAAAPPARGETPATPRRAVPALVLLAVGALAMLIFESPITRVIGVVALFGFVVAGAFAIADPRWLASAPELSGEALKPARPGKDRPR